MTIREETEAIERQTLSRYATLSENSLGRRVPLEPDPIRSATSIRKTLSN